jgi:L-asparaginase/Glu-tRNA(Gln) amidotransferase subunit D
MIKKMHSSNVDEFTHILLTMITSTDNTTLTHQQKDSKKKHEIHMD